MIQTLTLLQSQFRRGNQQQLPLSSPHHRQSTQCSERLSVGPPLHPSNFRAGQRTRVSEAYRQDTVCDGGAAFQHNGLFVQWNRNVRDGRSNALPMLQVRPSQTRRGTNGTRRRQSVISLSVVRYTHKATRAINHNV